MLSVTQLNSIKKILQIDNKLDFQLLQEALTHKSVKVKDKKIKDNERLEFLGDAVLELIVTEYLFANFSDLNEGELTALRSSLVKTDSLANEFKRLKLNKFIIMSGGEDAGGGRTNPYTLANFFESVLGAIYLSCGYEVSKAFVHRELLYKLDNIIKHKLHKNAKTQVQEIVQDHFKITPEYKEISSSGPDHNKVFEMGLYAGSIMLTTGKGNNKQKAEEYAAIEFLKKTDYYLEKIREKL